jgi:hypothetical protein
LDSKNRIKKVGNLYENQAERGRIYSIEGIAPTLKIGEKGGARQPMIMWIQSSQEEKGGVKTRTGLVPSLGERMGTGGGNIPLVVSGQTTMTSTPAKSTENTMEIKNSLKVTSEQSTLTQSPTSNFSLLDFLAKASRSQAKGKDLRTLAERYSTRLPELRVLKDLAYYFLKTSRDSSATTKDELLPKSFKRWTSWGMTSNGKCLTANISAFPRIGRECSLSDILEPNPPDKYFLSDKQTRWLQRKLQESKNRLALVSIAITGKEQINTGSEL